MTNLLLGLVDINETDSEKIFWIGVFKDYDLIDRKGMNPGRFFWGFINNQSENNLFYLPDLSTDPRLVKAHPSQISVVETSNMWGDIGGYKDVKQIIRESIIWPLQVIINVSKLIMRRKRRDFKDSALIRQRAFFFMGRLAAARRFWLEL